MRLYLVTLIVFLISQFTSAQELFVFTEPASNMPKGNLGIRAMNSLMREKVEDGFNYHLMPELMYGISDKWMVHASTFLSNRNSSLVSEGASFYVKYKFLNRDEVQRHFRMALFSRYSFNNADIHQDELNLIGHNSGFEFGIYATQLLHKLAIGGGFSYIQATDNRPNYEFPANQSNQAAYYTLSFGRLVLPKKYKDYKQTNLNVMCEFLGQSIIEENKNYLDIAPSVQFIFLSKMRLDIAYRQELFSSMQRTAPNGFVVRFEYNFFNVY